MLSISEVQLVHPMTGTMRRVDVEDYFSVQKVDDEIQAIIKDELVRHAADVYDDDHLDGLDDDDRYDTEEYYDDYILEAYRARAYKLKLIHSGYDDIGAYPDDDVVGEYPDGDVGYDDDDVGENGDDDIFSIS